MSSNSRHLATLGFLLALLGCDDSSSGHQIRASPEEPSSSPEKTPTRESRPRDGTEIGPPETVESRIPPPVGYKRVPADQRSFGSWLRRLPLRPDNSEVHLYDGRLKANQDAHYAVLDIDVGSEDLQQCADAVIRLRAEFLFSGSCRDEIHFNFTSGDTAQWSEWQRGIRPQVSGNRVSWDRTAPADSSYESFRRFLDTVFTYAGTASLEQELVPVSDPSQLKVGDVFIEGGFPGHAVLVIDVAENDEGKRVFLLAQSYMPAQDVHVLKSLAESNPWYPARRDGVLRTPEWDFWYRSLRRFPLSDCED